MNMHMHVVYICICYVADAVQTDTPFSASHAQKNSILSCAEQLGLGSRTRTCDYHTMWAFRVCVSVLAHTHTHATFPEGLPGTQTYKRTQTTIVVVVQVHPTFGSSGPRRWRRQRHRHRWPAGRRRWHWTHLRFFRAAAQCANSQHIVSGMTGPTLLYRCGAAGDSVVDFGSTLSADGSIMWMMWMMLMIEDDYVWLWWWRAWWWWQPGEAVDDVLTPEPNINARVHVWWLSSVNVRLFVCMKRVSATNGDVEVGVGRLDGIRWNPKWEHSFWFGIDLIGVRNTE